jgi:CelD/BcsL family acetyltransferase involved in cellulose biosynthesis
MELICIKDLNGFLSLKEEWNNLLSYSENNTLFLRHEWLSSWWESYNRDGELMVLLLKRNGVLVSAAPLMVLRDKMRGLPVKKVVFIGDSAWTTGDFIIREDIKGAVGKLMEYLLDVRYDMADFRNIPADSKNISAISKFLQTAGVDYLIHETSSAPFLRVDMTWKDFYARRSSKFRKTMRNKINRIEKAGEINVQKYSSPEEIKDVLPVIFGIGLKSWKHGIDNAICSTGGNRAFYTGLAETVAGLGWLNIWLLKFKGTPIAFEYHICYENRVYAILADYDEDYKNLSPGSILDFHIVKQLFEDKNCEYDLGCGNSIYKANWTDNIRRYVRFYIYRNTLYSRMFMLMEDRIVPCLKTFKEKVKVGLSLQGN